MKWTEKVVEQLKQLWDNGLSTAEIGRHLGITKNAVIGKAHRLKLPSRPSPIRKTTKVKPLKPARSKKTQETLTRSLADTRHTQQNISPATPPIEKPQPKTISPLPTEKPVEKSPTRKKKSFTPPSSISKSKIGKNTVLETESSKRYNSTCCWPLGDPGTPGFHFCGASPLPGKPYCEKHCQIAYVRLRPRGSRDSKS